MCNANWVPQNRTQKSVINDTNESFRLSSLAIANLAFILPPADMKIGDMHMGQISTSQGDPSATVPVRFNKLDTPPIQTLRRFRTAAWTASAVIHLRVGFGGATARAPPLPDDRPMTARVRIPIHHCVVVLRRAVERCGTHQSMRAPGAAAEAPLTTKETGTGPHVSYEACQGSGGPSSRTRLARLVAE